MKTNWIKQVYREAEGAEGSTGGAPAGDSPAAESPWYGDVGEEGVALIEQRGWKSPSDLLTSYRNVEKLASGAKDVLALPGEDADEATLNAFYGKLGRPESADQYSFELPENGDAQMDGWFRQVAHQSGLSDKQAANLYDAWNSMASERNEAAQTEMRQQGELAIKELRKEWGQAFDSQVHAGQTAVKTLGYSEDELSGLEAKVGTAEMMRLFAKIGSKMGEDSFADGSRSDGGFGVTPAQAQSQIDDLKSDKDFMDKYLSGDKSAQAKMQRLMGLAYG